jgi:hypothetical protein
MSSAQLRDFAFLTGKNFSSPQPGAQMKISLSSLCTAALLIAITGCDGEAPPADEISVTDHGDALSSNANDLLATVTLTSLTSGNSYAFNKLQVSVKATGQTAYIVPFDFTDTNTNGNFDQGESVVAKEGPIAKYGPGDAGTVYSIILMNQRPDNAYELIDQADWTAN